MTSKSSSLDDMSNEVKSLRQQNADLEAMHEAYARSQQAAAQVEKRNMREIEARYQDLFETMAQGVVYWDAEGKAISANPAAARILGRALVDLQTWQFSSPEHPLLAEDGTLVKQEDLPLQLALRHGKTTEAIVVGVYNPTQRSYCWLRSSAVPQFDEDNKLLGVFSTFDDITTRKRSMDNLRFLFNASAQLASSLDYETTLKTIVQSAVPELADWCSIDMLEPDNTLRRLAVAHVDPAKVALAYELWKRYPPDLNGTNATANVLRTGKGEFTPQIPELTEEMRIAAKYDVETWEILRNLRIRSSMIVPLLARGKTLGVISFVGAESGRVFTQDDLDVAQELANHAGLAVENARLYLQAQQNNIELETRVAARTAELEVTMRELESFSYSVSHDLRAPLRTIDGFSRAVIEDYADKLDDEGKNYLERVRAATHQMAQLIDDLLKLSRVSRSEMHREAVNLSDMVESIIAVLKAGEPIRSVTVEIEPNLIVTADPRLLRIAMDNLVDNAWKFTMKQPEAVIQFGMTNYENKQVYFICDNGAGFDMTYANKLFGAFQRLHSDNEFKGSGIGLATVQRILRRHGGQIWAEGSVGQGATFYFTL